MNTLYLAYFGLLYASTLGLLLAAYRWRQRPASGFLNTAFVLILLWSLAETVSAIRLVAYSGNPDAGYVMEGEYAELDPSDLQPRLKIRDPELGYAGRPGFSGRAAKRVDDRYAYDTRYTLDSSGYRVVPGSTGDSPDIHLFLGDSETFGTGVGDAETYASIYAQVLNGPRVINAAFEGYGPQHALEVLRLRAPRIADGGRITQVYYLVCCRHDHRIAGLSGWESEKLRFVLDEQGQLQFQGLQRRSALVTWLNRLFTFKLLREAALGWRLHTEPQEARDRLLAAALVEMRRRALALGAGYTLLFHRGTPDRPMPLDLAGLRRAGMEILDVADLMPAHVYSEGNFAPLDAHPDASWHQALGQALALRWRGLSAQVPPGGQR